jgi:hypothetical protein
LLTLDGRKRQRKGNRYTHSIESGVRVVAL